MMRMFRRLGGHWRGVAIYVLAAVLPTAFADQHETSAPVTSTPVTSATTASSIETRLSKIEHQLESGGLFNMLQEIEVLEKELARLQGEVKVNRHALEKMQQRQRDLYADIDRRLQRISSYATSEQPVGGEDTSELAADPILDPPLETLGMTEVVNPIGGDVSTDGLVLEQVEIPVQNEPPQPDDAPPAPSSDVIAKADPVQTQAQYQRAFQLLKISRYDQAIKAFGEFMENHPDDQYADNAQYWMAEALRVQGKLDEAIKAYRALINNYPDSQKIPQGVLKIGDSYKELGDLDQARLWYADVKHSFPDTTSSRIANERFRQAQ